MRIERWLHALPLQIRSLFRRREVERDLDDEILGHIESQTEQNIANGMLPDDARTAARRAFGNREVVRATARETWGWVWLEQIALDFRYAMRKLRRAPGFAAVATLSLAIGIGATVTMYAVIDAADIRGLPFPDADRLYHLNLVTTSRPNPSLPAQRRGISVPASIASDWQRFSRSFDAITTLEERRLFWPSEDENESAGFQTVGSDFLQLLGTRPVIGRLIAPSDTLPDAPPVAVLSYSTWRDRFASDRSVIGRALRFRTSFLLSGPTEVYTIIGVAARGADYPATTNGWITQRPGKRDDVYVLARLRTGRSIEAANAELNALTRAAAPPSGAISSVEVRAVSLRDRIRKIYSMGRPQESYAIESAKGRAVQFGVVFFVLVIAVINVGNLLLARTAARDHEMVVRAALGASRAWLSRQLLVEGACIAVLGGVLGVAMACGGVRLVGSLGSLATMGIVPVVDGRIVIFAILLTSIVALGAGFIPALSLARTRRSSERNESPKATVGRARTRLQGVLLVGQIGAALTLLTGAALLAKELLRLERQGVGFDQTNVVLLQRVGDARVARTDPQSRARFRDDMLARLAGVPGVSSVSEMERFVEAGFYPLGDPEKAEKDARLYFDEAVNPGFLANLRIPLIRGRDFVSSDYAGAGRVAIVSTSAAEHFWPGENPLGKQVVVPSGLLYSNLGIKADSLIVTVVGVIGNPRLGAEGSDIGIVTGEPPETLLRPMRSDVAGVSQFYVRFSQEPAASMPALRQAVTSAQGAPIMYGTFGSVQKMGIDAQLAEQKLITRALIAFASVALLLASIGIHGLVAFSVAQRTREIGIRMALGADASSVLMLVTRRGLRLAAAGIVMGVGGSLALTRVLRALLYGTSPTDPIVFTGSALLLAAVVLLASYLPARRATRVDPMMALRVE
jgi:putative ABC transport system permease protein